MYIASSFSNLKKMRWKPCIRRNSLSISLRRLYSAGLCSQGLAQLDFGGTTGENLRYAAKETASSRGPTISIRSRPRGASWHCPPLRINSAADRAGRAICAWFSRMSFRVVGKTRDTYQESCQSKAEVACGWHIHCAHHGFNPSPSFRLFPCFKLGSFCQVFIVGTRTAVEKALAGKCKSRP